MYGKQNYRLLFPQHWKADPTNSESRLPPRQPELGFLRLQRQQAGEKNTNLTYWTNASIHKQSHRFYRK